MIRRFFSVEYIDHDGDPNVQHAFMNETELSQLTDMLDQLGAESIKINDLTPVSVERALTVLSGNEDIPFLGTGT